MKVLSLIIALGFSVLLPTIASAQPSSLRLSFDDFKQSLETAREEIILTPQTKLVVLQKIADFSELETAATDNRVQNLMIDKSDVRLRAFRSAITGQLNDDEQYLAEFKKKIAKQPSDESVINRLAQQFTAWWDDHNIRIKNANDLILIAQFSPAVAKAEGRLAALDENVQKVKSQKIKTSLAKLIADARTDLADARKFERDARATLFGPPSEENSDAALSPAQNASAAPITVQSLIGEAITRVKESYLAFIEVAQRLAALAL